MQSDIQVIESPPISKIVVRIEVTDTTGIMLFGQILTGMTKDDRNTTITIDDYKIIRDSESILYMEIMMTKIG